MSGLLVCRQKRPLSPEFLRHFLPPAATKRRGNGGGGGGGEGGGSTPGEERSSSRLTAGEGGVRVESRPSGESTDASRDGGVTCVGRDASRTPIKSACRETGRSEKSGAKSLHFAWERE